MAIYFHGVVTCRQRQTRAVELTLEERDRLSAGTLPCPCCGERCRPTFEARHESLAAAVAWNGARWGTAVAATQREG